MMRVMTSWIVFSWAAENCEWPYLLAGTWKQYSANAISQLTSIARYSGEFLYFKWPYQANVMKIFDIVKSIIVLIWFSL